MASTASSQQTQNHVRPARWPIMMLAIVLPSIVTYVYFVLLSNVPPAIQQTAYSIGKAIQFLLPVVIVFAVNRESLRSSFATSTDAKTKNGLVGGIIFGLLVVAAMFVIYFAWLQHTPVGEKLLEAVQTKVQGMGLASVWMFAAVGVFYALIHSLLEEYYWRWFVFRYLKRLIPVAAANAISSLGFMAHHVLLLGFFIGWNEPLTYVFSLGIAVGGAAWAWIYDKTGSLIAPWISHMIVDAGIFALGYFLIKDIL